MSNPCGNLGATDGLDVRPLTPEQVPLVGSLLGLARLRQGNGFYLVGWRGEEPLGHVHLALTDPPELQDLAVRADHRRRGIGSALVAAAEREARRRGYDRMTLSVSAGEPGVQTFYRRAGYGDSGAPPRRVQGVVVIRTGPIEVDDVLLTWEKVLQAAGTAPRASADPPSP